MTILDVTRFEGFDPAVAAYLGALEFGRSGLVAILQKVSPEQLTVKPAGFRNTIATLVVHIAATEVSIAYRLQGRPVPAEILAEFPPRNKEFLPEVTGETVESLLAKLEKSRGILLEATKGITAADLTREIALGPERSATVAWLLCLLPNHMALHGGHIGMILQRT